MSADASAYAIEVEGLVNAVGAGQILHQNLNLKVRRDEVMTLIGGSGSGKTQLLEGDPRIEAPGRRLGAYSACRGTTRASRRCATRGAAWGCCSRTGRFFPP